MIELVEEPPQAATRPGKDQPCVLSREFGMNACRCRKCFSKNSAGNTVPQATRPSWSNNTVYRSQFGLLLLLEFEVH
jgi:hypothetical protein